MTRGVVGDTLNNFRWIIELMVRPLCSVIAAHFFFLQLGGCVII